MRRKLFVRSGCAAAALLTVPSRSAVVALTSVEPASENVDKPLLQAIVQARRARLAGDVDSWYAAAKIMVRLAPENIDLAVSGSRAAAASGAANDALTWLELAVRRGAGVDPSRYREFAALAGRPEFEALARRARANVRSVARSSLFATLSADPHEGLGYDRISRRLFSGSDNAAIDQIEPGGRVSRFVEGNGLRQVLGVEVDASRRVLWCLSGRYPDLFATSSPAPDDGTTGLYGFDLRTGRSIAAYDVDERPALHGFNDLTIASDGTLYLTDTPQNAIWRLRRGAPKLELFAREPDLTLPNGIAVSADSRLLYVATAEGIRVCDLVRGGSNSLAIPVDATVGNIDGLWYSDGALFGVQPSPYLGSRVVRIRLGAGGRSARSVTTLNSWSPAEYAYTTVVTAGRFAYAVGGAPAVDPYGSAPATSPMPHVIRIPL
jgi:SMP-30/Gluconolactonase/LRE-like region